MTRTAAIIGGGVIGGGWVARFLLNGWDVRVFDPDPEAERKIGHVLDNARLSLPRLYDVPLPTEGSLTFCSSVQETVQAAQWIQESVPETLAAKHRVYEDIQDHMADDAIIGSSTSGFKPSELQAQTNRPDRLMVAHPFNPVYLLPLVELVPSDQNSDAVIQSAKDLLTDIGMIPLHIRKEIDAHIADRLLESVWREALWLVRDDVATTEEVDNAIRYGFGIRWAQMGLFETYRTAGGEAGMHHFIRHFGPCLEWPWSRLTDVPDLDDALVSKIADQSDEQSGALSIRELERQRDENLVGILRALKDRNNAAGSHLNQHQNKLSISILDSPETTAPLELHRVTVLPSWIDYNGHMTEFRYLQVFGDTTDALLALIGLDSEYLASGYSFYTAETHIMNRSEAKLAEQLSTATQIIHADDKRLHIFHTIRSSEDQRIFATAEHMLLHVDTRTGKTCPMLPKIRGKLDPLAEAHAGLPKPEVLGRFTGQRASS